MSFLRPLRLIISTNRKFPGNYKTVKLNIILRPCSQNFSGFINALKTTKNPAVKLRGFSYSKLSKTILVYHVFKIFHCFQASFNRISLFD